MHLKMSASDEHMGPNLSHSYLFCVIVTEQVKLRENAEVDITRKPFSELCDT